MKLLTAAAVIALTTATAAYAQSDNSAPTNLTPSKLAPAMQHKAAPKTSQPAAMKGSRAQQDQSENQITDELNRQQLQMAGNAQNAPAAPQVATKPGDMPPSLPSQ